jgi:hypothetical protein
MALSYTTTDGTLYIPSAPAKWDVAPSTSGTSTTGVVVLVGEASDGPSYLDEDVTSTSVYGPSQKADVVAKFGSGRLVDAYLLACAPSKDPQVKGSPTQIVLIKTNQGTKASTTLTGGYAKLDAKSAGKNGNLISVTVATSSGSSTITIARKNDNISEQFVVGGSVAMLVSSGATVPTMTIGATSITGYSNGVSAWTAGLSDFKTLGDLAAFITSKGWSATVTPVYSQLSPFVLDEVSGADVSGGGFSVKKDAFDFMQAIATSRLVSVDSTIFPNTGLPASQTITFLNGGALGHTYDSNVIAALDQAARLRANFIVTLFSQDATTATTGDIAIGATDSSSTYTIAGVNAALSTHLSYCSQFKQRKPRQGFPSVSDTYANAKAKAQQMGSARMALSYLDTLQPNASGTLTWFQPWACAVVAAAMQASAGYRPIFNKALNVYGSRAPKSDFVVENQDALEDAIRNGLLILAPRMSDGVMSFVSDQTTYGYDNNFVYNSIQAVYTADTIAMTVSDKMEKAFIGQNFADVSAAIALSYLKSILSELYRLKLMVSSDDAPGGYKNASVQISPPAMLVSAEIKPGTGVYFIPIRFLLTQPTQSA